MATLFVIKGKDQGLRFDLNRDVVSIGRLSGNTIQLNDVEVSRNHAELRSGDGHHTLTDLSSANGTFVNGQQVAAHTLRNGDRLEIGGTTLIYTAAEEPVSEDHSGVVEFIGPQRVQGSRIIQTMAPEEGSQLFTASGQDESEWLQTARNNLQIMYRTSVAVSRTLDIDQLLERLMEMIFEWVEADRGCIMLTDQHSGELTPRASRSRHNKDEEDGRILISRTILDYVLESNEGVLTTDAREDQRWDPGGSIVQMGVREAVCVPMQGRYGVVGVIYIDAFTPPAHGNQKPKFTNEHLKLMVAIGHQAALAVEDTSYYSAMVQAERLAAMGQTIATLSHHIKNILQGIRGGSYLIEEGLKSSEPDVVRRGWNIVDKNQEKISNLVMDMLTFSKEREPDLVAAQLNEVVHDVVELMQTRAKDAGVELRWMPDAATPELTFDPDGMHRAVLNIVTNAIDACRDEEDGAVEVSTAYDPLEEKAVIRVRDTGEGIPPGEMEKIFSVFESSKGNRGTGLGLPVSQKILQEHGGEIRVESQPGEGSTFILQFPAVVPGKIESTDTLNF